ncbi:MAG: class I SAM-dependent methyltransferase [Desulfobacteraceae bacterium]|jgi:predicted TPR repeat methyltransferase
MQKTPDLWTATYEAKTQEELDQAYCRWVDKYDHDTRTVMGYVGPDLAAAMLDYHLDSSESKVLDVGCGTGLVGEVLHSMGYENIEATDVCQDMLSEAEKKDVYDRVFQSDLSQRICVPNNNYDATICVGTFTYAHVGPEAFRELVRVTKPDGYICFTIRDGAYEDYGYRAKMVELEAGNQWELQEMRTADYLVKENVQARFCTYKVIEG